MDPSIGVSSAASRARPGLLLGHHPPEQRQDAVAADDPDHQDGGTATVGGRVEDQHTSCPPSPRNNDRQQRLPQGRDGDGRIGQEALEPPLGARVGGRQWQRGGDLEQRDRTGPHDPGRKQRQHPAARRPFVRQHTFDLGMPRVQHFHAARHGTPPIPRLTASHPAVSHRCPCRPPSPNCPGERDQGPPLPARRERGLGGEGVHSHPKSNTFNTFKLSITIIWRSKQYLAPCVIPSATTQSMCHPKRHDTEHCVIPTPLREETRPVQPPDPMPRNCIEFRLPKPRCYDRPKSRLPIAESPP